MIGYSGNTRSRALNLINNMATEDLVNILHRADPNSLQASEWDEFKAEVKKDTAEAKDDENQNATEAPTAQKTQESYRTPWNPVKMSGPTPGRENEAAAPLSHVREYMRGESPGKLIAAKPELPKIVETDRPYLGSDDSDYNSDDEMPNMGGGGDYGF